MKKYHKDRAISDVMKLAAKAPPIPKVEIKVGTTTYKIFNTAAHLGIFAKRLEKLPQIYFETPKRKGRPWA